MKTIHDIHGSLGYIICSHLNMPWRAFPNLDTPPFGVDMIWEGSQTLPKTSKLFQSLWPRWLPTLASCGYISQNLGTLKCSWVSYQSSCNTNVLWTVFQLLPKKLTWNLEMMVSNRNLLFQGSIFRFHVCFGGCMSFNLFFLCAHIPS